MLAKIGLDPTLFQAHHPRIVLYAITPFGQTAPPERRHAEDLTVFNASVWAFHTPSGMDDSRPPLKGPGRFLVSYEAGLEGAMCVTAALYRREETGLGQFIDLSKQEVMASRVDYVLGQMVAGEMDVSDRPTAFDLGGPAAIFPCREGFAYIWLSAPEHWKALRRDSSSMCPRWKPRPAWWAIVLWISASPVTWPVWTVTVMRRWRRMVPIRARETTGSVSLSGPSPSGARSPQ